MLPCGTPYVIQYGQECRHIRHTVFCQLNSTNRTNVWKVKFVKLSYFVNTKAKLNIYLSPSFM